APDVGLVEERVLDAGERVRRGLPLRDAARGGGVGGEVLHVEPERPAEEALPERGVGDGPDERAEHHREVEAAPVAPERAGEREEERALVEEPLREAVRVARDEEAEALDVDAVVLVALDAEAVVAALVAPLRVVRVGAAHGHVEAALGEGVGEVGEEGGAAAPVRREDGDDEEQAGPPRSVGEGSHRVRPPPWPAAPPSSPRSPRTWCGGPS